MQPPAVAVGLGPRSSSAPASEPASGSDSANAGTTVAGHHAGQPALARRVAAGLEDRVGAQPLQGERGLGLGADRGQGLAQQAQLHRGGVARQLVAGAAEQPAQQPGGARSAQQRAVDRAVHGLDLHQALGGHLAHPRGVLLLRPQ